MLPIDTLPTTSKAPAYNNNMQTLRNMLRVQGHPVIVSHQNIGGLLTFKYKAICTKQERNINLFSFKVFFTENRMTTSIYGFEV